MKISRLKSLVYRDYLIFIKSKWRWLEFFYFPITSIIIWGLFAIWTGEFASEAGKIALFINVFWSYSYVVQTTINLSINEDAWHSEIHHIFITGIGKWEYLLGRIIFSLLLSSINLSLMLLITHIFFLNLTQIISEVIPFIFLTTFLSVTIAIFIAGLYFILGRDYAWISWASLQFFILLSFPLSPLEILPYHIQVLARMMPYGNFFEGLKNLLLKRPYFQEIFSSVLISFLYLLIGVLTYKFGFDHSRKTGKFAKMF
ncbi:MAG: hypothetical protein QW040_00815 [Candidatus Aenigmatarchaeota archaeon]